MKTYLPIKYKIQEACERTCVRYLNREYNSRERNTWLQRLIFKAASALEFRLRSLPKASKPPMRLAPQQRKFLEGKGKLIAVKGRSRATGFAFFDERSYWEGE